MLRSIAEQKLKLFRTIDSLGQKELFDVEKIVSDYLEARMKEKEAQFSVKMEREEAFSPRPNSDVDEFWKNVEEINETKQLSAFQNVHDSLQDDPSLLSRPQTVPVLDNEQMLGRFRHLNLHSDDAV